MNPITPDAIRDARKHADASHYSPGDRDPEQAWCVYLLRHLGIPVQDGADR